LGRKRSKAEVDGCGAKRGKKVEDFLIDKSARKRRRKARHR
jgi:hypothetical protein